MWEQLAAIIKQAGESFGPAGAILLIVLIGAMWIFAPIFREALKRPRELSEEEIKKLKEAHEYRDRRDDAIREHLNYLITADRRREEEAKRHADLLDRLERRTHDDAVAMTNAISAIHGRRT
jgi:hypothetical protein